MKTLASGTWREATLALERKIQEAFQRWRNAPEHLQTLGLRLEVSLAHTNPTVWLCAQAHPEQMLWAPRGTDRCRAGVGMAHLLTGDTVEEPGGLFDRGRSVLQAFREGTPRYFGGFSFSSRSVDEAPWPRLGRSRFWIPRFELLSEAGESRLVCNLFFQRHVQLELDTLLQELSSLQPAPEALPPLPPILSRTDFPGPADWEGNVRAALDLIRSGLLDKVVLARKAVYRFAEPVTAARILAVLTPVTSNCYHFLLQADPAAAFMGTTPECLYHREGRNLRTEALAGTRSRDDDPVRDAELSEELLNTAKDRHEQELVRRDVLRQLHLLSEHLESEERPGLLKLERKQHLLSRITATLRPGVTDAELLKALHPTPAVGGSPRSNALQEIPRLEPFSRGWYAAPVGSFGLEDAEFAVAIRSGLVRGADVNVYSGAGIVEGSDPAAEWQEIENKISDFVKVTRPA